MSYLSSLNGNSYMPTFDCIGKFRGGYRPASGAAVAPVTTIKGGLVWNTLNDSPRNRDELQDVHRSSKER